ncbi:MAG: J domain-containing protein [Solirubrobacterales bacterium]
MKEDPYEILGVRSDATEKEIRAAYIAGAKRFHPDVVGAAESGEKMRQLNLAYEILKDATMRAQYDSESQNSAGLFGDLEDIVRVRWEEASFTTLSQQKVAALNREMVLMEKDGWDVERVHDHLVCTRTDRSGLFSKARKRRVTVNIDRNGNAFHVEQMRPA